MLRDLYDPSQVEESLEEDEDIVLGDIYPPTVPAPADEGSSLLLKLISKRKAEDETKDLET
jgi:hypothetical protein